MSDKFAMPEVFVGDPVHWSPAPGREPAAAVVTAVGPEAISVCLLAENARTVLPRDAVRHADDPATRKIITDSGVWRHTPRTLRVEARLAAIEAKYRELVG